MKWHESFSLSNRLYADVGRKKCGWQQLQIVMGNLVIERKEDCEKEMCVFVCVQPNLTTKPFMEGQIPGKFPLVNHCGGALSVCVKVFPLREGLSPILIESKRKVIGNKFKALVKKRRALTPTPIFGDAGSQARFSKKIGNGPPLNKSISGSRTK